MTPERWQQVDLLYHEVRERAPAERVAFLDEACASDAELRREIESLLAFDEQANSFIETPPDDIAAGLIAEEQARSMIGRTLGHYQLRSKIGAGGMGEVYRARDTRLDRDVAVKILPEHLADNPEALRRFEREAKAVAALSHPNILSIHDFGTEAGVSYTVMELLEGETLRACLPQSALDWHRAVEIGIAVAEGLAAAHAKGIVHRDLKPENIFLTEDGQVKILDFGIARVKHIVTADSETLTSLEITRPGTIMGTIGYMSPEQVRGEEANAPSDMFSLGCVLYEMASGRRPFAHATTAETIAAILKEEPAALTYVNPKIPGELERVIRHCLEKKPGERFQSARDLAFDLKSLLGSGGGTMPTAAHARLRIRPVWIGLAVISLVLMMTTLLYLFLWRERAIDSLAVLPLVNTSADIEMEYLSDGITESLINSLSQLPALRVMARSTVFSYKGQTVDPQEVGRKLKVSAVLTGKMTQRGDTLSIMAELVKVTDGSQLWGKKYEQKLANVLMLQAEIAKQISEQLRLALTTEQQQRLITPPTKNTEAYFLYTRGRYFSSNFWTADGFKKGIDQLNHAIALDPAYALAHAGLAATYYEASSVWLSPNDAMPKVKAAALKALELDDNLAEAHTALAQALSLYEWNWGEAEKHYQRALELNPNFAQAHQYYGICLAHRGQMEAGAEEIKQAQRLDPLTPSTSLSLVLNYYAARRYDEAIAQCRKILEIKSDFYMAHSMFGLVYEQQGKLAEAIAEFKEARRIDPEQPFTLGYLGHGYALAGQRDEAQKMLAEMKQMAAKGTYVNPVPVAFIYVGLGEKDNAFAQLEKAYQERDENLVHYKDAPIFDSIRTDSRFTYLLRRMNLVP